MLGYGEPGYAERFDGDRQRDNVGKDTRRGCGSRPLLTLETPAAIWSRLSFRRGRMSSDHPQTLAIDDAVEKRSLERRTCG
jgi:hypothetical protein